ncbi:hypothetical protein T05_12540, partial [Trichinella murrelli]
LIAAQLLSERRPCPCYSASSSCYGGFFHKYGEWPTLQRGVSTPVDPRRCWLPD